MTDFPQPGNAQIGVEQSHQVTASAVGAQAGGVLTRPRTRVSMQVSFDGMGATVKVRLEGTINGTNWVTLATFDTGAGSVTGDIVTGSTHVVSQVRAYVETLSAGNVTATILLAGPNS